MPSAEAVFLAIDRHFLQAGFRCLLAATPG